MPRQSHLQLALIPTALLVIGTLGYFLIEPEYSLFDSLYMTVITITTVGYGETRPLSTAGRWFTMGLLLGGVFTMFYAATELLRSIVTGELRQVFGRGYMERGLATLSGHLIVCGFGRMGRSVTRELNRQGQAFVVVDRRSDLASHLPADVWSVVGDATSDEILRQAGVERARALVSVTPSDSDNLYITMSARLLNSKLFIVARAESQEAERKLRRAGADRVISPYELSGSKIAQAVIRPAVLEFIELATQTEHLELQIEQTLIASSSPLIGTDLASSRLRSELGLIIVAIKKRTGAMIYTPPAETKLEEGDTLIALGRRAQLDRLETLSAGKAAV